MFVVYGNHSVTTTKQIRTTSNRVLNSFEIISSNRMQTHLMKTAEARVEMRRVMLSILNLSFVIDMYNRIVESCDFLKSLRFLAI